MANSNVNKVIYGSQVLIDLTADTVEAGKLLKGYTAHDKSGAVITGTCTFDVNSQDGTAAVAEILSGKTAYARGSKLTGTMPNNGAVVGEISEKNGVYAIPLGFHDGSGSVAISQTEQDKIVAGNIKAGVEILGVTGTYSGEAITAQSKAVTPKTTAQTIQPDTGYDYLSAVTVNAIPYTESDNSAGGKTVTIG
ncbi:TPA: hypothetical protein TVN79_002004 [Streptococcus equi subsp. zooepidemicus]|nr:hypothetical protein [Streptococcus equi subsp. zooepidemicus]HEL1236293.1 hypothetical protein [Streptococcus equi subsp. zooepidemicus]